VTNRLKVMTVLGTRPEIIRLSAVIARLDEVVDHVLVHTGQNYDYELNEVFFEDLGVRKPDHFMSIDASTLGRAYGNILIGTETLLLEEKPDALLVLGDTNSAIAAIMAKRMQVPVYHMEAGNRSFDQNVPEEVNRRIVDHIADFNLVYTERSREHLMMEGLSPRRTYLTGSPLREVFDNHRDAIEASTAVEDLGLTSGEFFLVSVHRQENVDDPSRLARVLDCLTALAEAYDLPVVVSTHPRTRNRLEELERPVDERIRFMKPFGYLDYNKLQASSRCVVSDSGSIAEESAIMGFAAVTLRESMERPEALDAGTLPLTGLDPATLLACVELQIRRHAGGRIGVPADYTINDTSDRAVSLILGTARLSNAWAGVRQLP
jgi:UDP-N-acetylglucosamine 2-epimerase